MGTLNKIAWFFMVSMCGVYFGISAVAAVLPSRDDRPQVVPLIQVQNPQQPQVVAAPSLLPPTEQSNLLTIIAAAFTTIFGGKTVSDAIRDHKKPDIKGLLSDPALRGQVDAMLLEAIQSGRVGSLVQGGLGLIPGASPIVGIVEPIARRVAIEILGRRNDTTMSPTTNPTGMPTDPASRLHWLVGELDSVLDSLKQSRTS